MKCAIILITLLLASCDDEYVAAILPQAETINCFVSQEVGDKLRVNTKYRQCNNGQIRRSSALYNIRLKYVLQSPENGVSEDDKKSICGSFKVVKACENLSSWKAPCLFLNDPSIGQEAETGSIEPPDYCG